VKETSQAMERARRRRHVPAFGEWNYYSSSSPDEPQLPPSGSCDTAQPGLWYAPEPEVCSDVWFRYSPPQRRPAPKKARRPAVAQQVYYGGAAVVARTPARGVRRVVKRVDEDLYQVPPPDNVSGRSRRVSDKAERLPLLA
jgi:hypothetical protein